MLLAEFDHTAKTLAPISPEFPEVEDVLDQNPFTPAFSFTFKVILSYNNFSKVNKFVGCLLVLMSTSREFIKSTDPW